MESQIVNVNAATSASNVKIVDPLGIAVIVSRQIWQGTDSCQHFNVSSCNGAWVQMLLLLTASSFLSFVLISFSIFQNWFRIVNPIILCKSQDCTNSACSVNIAEYVGTAGKPL